MGNIKLQIGCDRLTLNYNTDTNSYSLDGSDEYSVSYVAIGDKNRYVAIKKNDEFLTSVKIKDLANADSAYIDVNDSNKVHYFANEREIGGSQKSLESYTRQLSCGTGRKENKAKKPSKDSPSRSEMNVMPTPEKYVEEIIGGSSENVYPLRTKSGQDQEIPIPLDGSKFVPVRLEMLKGNIISGISYTIISCELTDLGNDNYRMLFVLNGSSYKAEFKGKEDDGFVKVRLFCTGDGTPHMVVGSYTNSGGLVSLSNEMPAEKVPAEKRDDAPQTGSGKVMAGSGKKAESSGDPVRTSPKLQDLLASLGKDKMKEAIKEIRKQRMSEQEAIDYVKGLKGGAGGEKEKAPVRTTARKEEIAPAKEKYEPKRSGSSSGGDPVRTSPELQDLLASLGKDKMKEAIKEIRAKKMGEQEAIDYVKGLKGDAGGEKEKAPVRTTARKEEIAPAKEKYEPKRSGSSSGGDPVRTSPELQDLLASLGKDKMKEAIKEIRAKKMNEQDAIEYVTSLKNGTPIETDKDSGPAEEPKPDEKTDEAKDTADGKKATETPAAEAEPVKPKCDMADGKLSSLLNAIETAYPDRKEKLIKDIAANDLDTKQAIEAAYLEIKAIQDEVLNDNEVKARFAELRNIKGGKEAADGLEKEIKESIPVKALVISKLQEKIDSLKPKEVSAAGMDEPPVTPEEETPPAKVEPKCNMNDGMLLALLGAIGKDYPERKRTLIERIAAEKLDTERAKTAAKAEIEAIRKEVLVDTDIQNRFRLLRSYDEKARKDADEIEADIKKTILTKPAVMDRLDKKINEAKQRADEEAKRNTPPAKHRVIANLENDASFSSIGRESTAGELEVASDALESIWKEYDKDTKSLADKTKTPEVMNEWKERIKELAKKTFISANALFATKSAEADKANDQYLLSQIKTDLTSIRNAMAKTDVVLTRLDGDMTDDERKKAINAVQEKIDELGKRTAAAKEENKSTDFRTLNDQNTPQDLMIAADDLKKEVERPKNGDTEEMIKKKRSVQKERASDIFDTADRATNFRSSLEELKILLAVMKMAGDIWNKLKNNDFIDSGQAEIRQRAVERLEARIKRLEKEPRDAATNQEISDPTIIDKVEFNYKRIKNGNWTLYDKVTVKYELFDVPRITDLQDLLNGALSHSMQMILNNGGGPSEYKVVIIINMDGHPGWEQKGPQILNKIKHPFKDFFVYFEPNKIAKEEFNGATLINIFPAEGTPDLAKKENADDLLGQCWKALEISSDLGTLNPF